MTKKRIQAPHKMKCEHCDVGFAKIVKSDELINGKKHCVYYCEHCKNYQLYEQIEHHPKRFTATTSRGLYCWDNVTGKRYDAVDDFFEMMDLLNALHEENEQLKQTMQEVAELLSDEVDLFSDKAIEHDINAYIELKELDNKDAYYMAKATKTAIRLLKGDVE